MIKRHHQIGFLLFCLLLLWFVSGVSRKNGWMIFLFGFFVVVGFTFLARRGKLKPLFVACLILVLSAAALGLVEGALWLKPDLISGEAALHAYGGYHVEPGGIYERHRHTGYAMKPNFSRRIYWNGYWWLHQANDCGYRGENVANPEAVFLGDSMIYGHGVENHQTPSSRFHARTGLTVANLGQQGTSLVQMAVRLQEIGLNWHPKFVFLCSHYNDIAEVAMWYPPEEAQKYVQSPMGKPYLLSAHKICWPRPLWKFNHFWNRNCALVLRSAGALQYLRRRLVQSGVERNTQVEKTAFQTTGLPSNATITATFAPWSQSATDAERLGWKANVRAIEQIDTYCNERRAKLIVFDLGYPTAFSKAIEKVAAQHKITYVAIGRRLLTRALAGEDVYLPNDGHWSGNGCDLVAESLAEQIVD